MKNLIYKILSKKKIFVYILICFTSICIELLIRKILIQIGLSIFFATTTSLLTGITICLILNIKFNFKIPRHYYKQSFVFFFIISLGSFWIQNIIKYFINNENLNFEESRLIISGFFFLFGYYLHTNFSFKKNKKVGIAIYLNEDKNPTNLDDIFSKIEYYPDYIHVDLIDKSINPKCSEIDFDKMKRIKKKWPNHEMHLHLMTKYPSRYINKLSSFFQIIYFNYEIEEDNKKISNMIRKSNTTPGIILHAKKKYKNLSEITKNYSEVLLLSIENPGYSGQIFLDNAIDMIKKINLLNNRKSFNLCVDGGLLTKHVNILDCDKFVSASNILKNQYPKKQIKKFQI